MVSRRQRLLNGLARCVQKPLLAAIRHQPLARRVVDLNARLLYPTPRGLRIRPETLRAEGRCVPAAWVDAGGTGTGGTMLYLHGGAFVIGSLRAYRHLVARLADAAGMRGLFVDYRLAPEHPFPAAPDDALTAYRALLEAGEPPARIVLAGDSAGGNLALALLHRIGQAGLPRPAGVGVMSPVADLTGASPSLTANRRRDPLVPLAWLRRGTRLYLAGADPADPVASPLFGTFAGAGPVLVQAAEGEVLFDDARRMAEALVACGVAARLSVWQGVPHVWHLNAGLSPEADRGVAELARFLRDCVPRRAGPVPLRLSPAPAPAR